MPRNPSLGAFSIADRRVLVTGGTAGIGRAVASHFAAAGADVVIVGRRASGEEVAEQIGAHFVRLDLEDAAAIPAAVDGAAGALGGLDCVILNAGLDLDAGSVEAPDMTAFRRVFEVNLFSVAEVLSASVGHIPDGGTAIVTSSPAATVTGPGFFEYSASKAAVNMLVRAAAIELAPRHIRVNAIVPGVVATAINGDEADQLAVFTASGTVSQPEDLVNVFHFLASEASRPITGAVIQADDGIGAGYSLPLADRAFSEKRT